MSNYKRTFKTQFVADFETLHAETEYFKNLEEKDTRIIYGYAQNIDNESINAEGIDKNDFWEWLMSHTKNTTIGFHNLAFDGTFIIPILEDNGFKVVSIDLSGDTLNITNGLKSDGTLKSRYFKVFMNGNKIYEIVMYHKRKVNGKDVETTLQFRCSLAMLSSSVSALGQSLGISKHLEGQNNKEFYIVEPQETLSLMYEKSPEFVDYCKRDVEIVIKSLKAFVEAINELPSIKNYLMWKQRTKNPRPYQPLDKSITIGGLGRILMSKIYVPFYEKKYYKELFNQKDLLKIDFKTHQFIKSEKSNFYKGGFVQYNPEYLTNQENKWLKDGIKIDVVSAYPYQMTFSMPYGSIMDSIEWENFKDDHKDVKGEHGVNYQEGLIIDVAISKPKPISKYCCNINNGVKAYDEKKNKYRYNPHIQKDYRAYLSRQEGEELQHGSEFEIVNIQYFYQLSAPFLKDYAEEIISMKTLFGKQKKGGFKQAMKILANSAYGSLGIRMLFETLAQCSNEAYEWIKEQSKEIGIDVMDFNKKSGETQIKYCGDSLSKSFINTKGIRFVEPLNEEKMYFNIACAALITSLQRCYIWRTIREIGPEYFCYSDTDSIIFSNFPPSTRKKIVDMCGVDLGMGEIEKEYVKGFTCRKAKDYAVVYLDKDGNEHLETKNAGFKEDTELKTLLTDFFYNDGHTYEDDELKIKSGSTTRIKYRSGIILLDIDKINKKTSL